MKGCAVGGFLTSCRRGSFSDWRFLSLFSPSQSQVPLCFGEQFGMCLPPSLCAECGVWGRRAFPPGREGEHPQLPGKLLAFRLAAPAWPPSDSSSARWAWGWGPMASTAPLMTGAAGSSDPETHESRDRPPRPVLETLGSANKSEREWSSRVFAGFIST